MERYITPSFDYALIGASLSEPHSSEYYGEEIYGVYHRTVVRSHTVCSNLVLAYSILLSKIVTTINWYRSYCACA